MFEDVRFEIGGQKFVQLCDLPHHGPGISGSRETEDSFNPIKTDTPVVNNTVQNPSTSDDGAFASIEMSPCRNICIIGAGRVGSLIAWGIIQKGLAEKVNLHDCDEDMLLGQSEDLKDAAEQKGGVSVEIGFTTYADLYIITAGKARKSSKDRHDFRANYKLVRKYADTIGQAKPILKVTNPVDKIASRLQLEGFNAFPMGVMLDAARSSRGRDPDTVAGFILDKKGYTCYGIATEVIKWLEGGR
jgi:hypothetical protein